MSGILCRVTQILAQSFVKVFMYFYSFVCYTEDDWLLCAEETVSALWMAGPKAGGLEDIDLASLRVCHFYNIWHFEHLLFLVCIVFWFSLCQNWLVPFSYILPPLWTKCFCWFFMQLISLPCCCCHTVFSPLLSPDLLYNSLPSLLLPSPPILRSRPLTSSYVVCKLPSGVWGSPSRNWILVQQF